MASVSPSEDSSASSHLRERIANVHLETQLSLKQVSLKWQEGCGNVKRLKRAVVRVIAEGKASLMTCRLAAECLLLSMEVTAEGPGTIVFYQYNHWLISSR